MSLDTAEKSTGRGVKKRNATPHQSRNPRPFTPKLWHIACDGLYLRFLIKQEAQSSSSHRRVFLVEVMGRGYLLILKPSAHVTLEASAPVGVSKPRASLFSDIAFDLREVMLDRRILLALALLV
jgi:hypothetical protein